MGTRDVSSGWGPTASYPGAVKSAPFVARFEQTESVRGPASHARLMARATGLIYRDSDGRVRREFHVEKSGGETFELVIICDFEARTVIALDTASKEATLLTDMGPPAGTPFLEGWCFRGPCSSEADPGRRVIEGVECRRASVAPPPGVAATPKEAGEIWLSDDIKFSVLEHVTHGEREHTWRLFGIQRVEPPSKLFVVPAGYTEVVRSKHDAPPQNRATDSERE